MVHTRSYHVISKPIICSKLYIYFLICVTCQLELWVQIKWVLVLLIFFGYNIMNRISWTSPDDFDQGILAILDTTQCPISQQAQFCVSAHRDCSSQCSKIWKSVILDDFLESFLMEQPWMKNDFKIMRLAIHIAAAQKMWVYYMSSCTIFSCFRML